MDSRRREPPDDALIPLELRQPIFDENPSIERVIGRIEATLESTTKSVDNLKSRFDDQDRVLATLSGQIGALDGRLVALTMATEAATMAARLTSAGKRWGPLAGLLTALMAASYWIYDKLAHHLRWTS